MQFVRNRKEFMEMFDYDEVIKVSNITDGSIGTGRVFTVAKNSVWLQNGNDLDVKEYSFAEHGFWSLTNEIRSRNNNKV